MIRLDLNFVKKNKQNFNKIEVDFKRKYLKLLEFSISSLMHTLHWLNIVITDYYILYYPNFFKNYNTSRKENF
jgi:hypothetical protein